VIAAMLHLSKPGYLRDLLARNRWEFAVAAIVVAGELTLGVLQGIALGVALSLLLLIYRTSHPQGAVLGQLPGTEAYRDVQRHREALTFPGLLIWRVGGDLFFASIAHFDEELKAALAASRPPAKHVLLDADSGELHRHQRLRRAAELHQAAAKSKHRLRVRPCARRGTGADAARRHRGCGGLGQLPRTCDRRRGCLAAAGKARCRVLATACRDIMHEKIANVGICPRISLLPRRFPSLTGHFFARLD
jgi:MFS superfamily sulfate permease-like transporter